MPSQINQAFMSFGRRADMAERTQLVETFVDAGTLFTLLSTHDHQVMYGRRGTGKTHALLYLAETRRAAGDIVSYVDLRVVGSTGGLYADPELSVTERATRLLVDTLHSLHDALLSFSIEYSEQVDLSQAGPLLDRIAEATTNVRVVGETEQVVAGSSSSSQQDGVSARIGLSQGTPVLGAAVAAESSRQETKSTQITERGIPRHRIHFAAVRDAVQSFTELVRPRRIWFILDEWSDIPLDLQPLLADLLRRSIFPIRGITVKFGAIEHRSRFRISGSEGQYIGIELGADAVADLNLDDFMVFDNNAERAKEFFREFLYKHYRAVAEPVNEDAPRSPHQLIQRAFTQRSAFDEFVRAIEGVPRDAINILTLAAQRALDDPISVPNIRAASKTWYQRDKESAASSREDALALLNWIVDDVIGGRKARAFLLRSNIQHSLINSLFDSRVLHVLKRSISAHDQPGIRYDVSLVSG